MRLRDNVLAPQVLVEACFAVEARVYGLEGSMTKPTLVEAAWAARKPSVTSHYEQALVEGQRWRMR